MILGLAERDAEPRFPVKPRTCATAQKTGKGHTRRTALPTDLARHRRCRAWRLRAETRLTGLSTAPRRPLGPGSGPALLQERGDRDLIQQQAGGAAMIQAIRSATWSGGKA